MPVVEETPVFYEYKTSISVGNLSDDVQLADIEDHFKRAGELTTVKFAWGRNGRCTISVCVGFATEEATKRALQMNCTELSGRVISVELAHEQRVDWPAEEVCVRGFDTRKEQILMSLLEHFRPCGDVSHVEFNYDNNSCCFAFLSFNNRDGPSEALKLDGSYLGGSIIIVEEEEQSDDFELGAFCYFEYIEKPWEAWIASDDSKNVRVIPIDFCRYYQLVRDNKFNKESESNSGAKVAAFIADYLAKSSVKGESDAEEKSIDKQVSSKKHNTYQAEGIEKVLVLEEPLPLPIKNSGSITC